MYLHFPQTEIDYFTLAKTTKSCGEKKGQQFTRFPLYWIIN